MTPSCKSPIDRLRPWQTRTHCCGHVVADTNVSPFACARNICCGHKICVRDTKNVSDFVQKHLCPQQMFPSLRSPRNIMSNNVSSFASTFNFDFYFVEFKPLPGAAAFQLSNPPLLQTVSLLGSLNVSSIPVRFS